MEENAAFGSGTSTTKQLKLEVGLSTNTRHGTNKYQKFKSNGRKIPKNNQFIPNNIKLISYRIR